MWNPFFERQVDSSLRFVGAEINGLYVIVNVRVFPGGRDSSLQTFSLLMADMETARVMPSFNCQEPTSDAAIEAGAEDFDCMSDMRWKVISGETSVYL